MTRLKKLLNISEERVDQLLDEWASEHGYRILIKTRLRDVIDADHLSLTQREKNYLWTSHIDFVILDKQTKFPTLAVEYDGPSHSSPEQMERDRIKNRICKECNLPLLRIDSNYARREGRWVILKYILWAHEMGKAFHEAQNKGYIPLDEVFYHGTIVDRVEDGEVKFTGLDTPAIEKLSKFRKKYGALWQASWWRTTPTHVEAQQLLAMPNDLYLAAKCRVRDFAIEGISAIDVAEELATVELAWLSDRYAHGEPVALGPKQAHRLEREMDSWHLYSGWGAARPN